MRYFGVFNRDGGTFRTTDMDDFCDKAREIVAAQGHELTIMVVAGADIAAAIEEGARDPHVDVLLAGGGDGTISTAAGICFANDVPLGVVPAGTMNLFARALGLPQTPLEALIAIAGGQVEAVDIATANGKPFIHQFSVGIHARLVRIRDGLTYNSRIGKMLASLRAVAAAIIDPPAFPVRLSQGGEISERMTSGISISNNPVAEGHAPHADSLDQGLLGVYIAEPMGTQALARLFLQLMLGRWKDNPQVSEVEVRQVTLDFPKRKRGDHAVMDGELLELSGHVEIALHPRALHVVVPSPKPAVDAETIK